MTRRMKIVRNVGIGLAGLIFIVVIAGLLIIRTDWFRNFVREKIITATEEGTGGRVEIGSFAFDWTHLTATVTNFVIRGKEPAGAPPYLRADRVTVHVRLFTSFKHLLDITYLGIEHPQANIMVAADGSTNVPQPKPSQPSKGAPLQSIVDLAVGRFDLSNGALTYNSRQQNMEVHGESLRVQLWYDTLKQGYQGELALTPLYVASGKNTPVRFRIDLPVTVQADRIAFHNARILTDASQLTIDGAIDNLRDPRTSAHIQGAVALSDLKNAADLQVPNTRGMPPSVQLDVNATVAGNLVNVVNARVAYGGSSIEASGPLQSSDGSGSLRFQANLALAELGRLENVSARPEGTVRAAGTAKLDAQHNYDVQADIDSSPISFQQGTRRIRNVTIASGAHLTPHRLDLSNFRIGALGADVTGNASLEDFARYSVNAALRHLDLRTAARQMGGRNLGYDGTISGPIAATGNLKAAGTTSLAANARLSIAPGRQGIPVTGRLFVDYRGNTDDVEVHDSVITLPHTRVTIAGSLGSVLNVSLSTTGLGDFAPLTGGSLPVSLAGGGRISFDGRVTGRLSSPQVTGHLAADRFTVEGRHFDSMGADVTASSARASVSAGSIRRDTMLAQFGATVGLVDWSPAQNQPVSLQATVRDGDLADVIALAGSPPEGYSGALSADVNVSGSIANPRGAANLRVANGTLDGEPIDSLQAQVNLADQLVTISNTQVVSGSQRVDLAAEFHHPRDRFNTGQIHAHVQTSPLDLSRLQTVQKMEPNSGGTVQVTADLSGDLSSNPKSTETEFEITNVSADANGRALRLEGQNYGDFSAIARTSGQAVQYNVTSDFAGSRIRVNGNTQLTPGYRTAADANVSGLAIEKVLVLAKKTDLPVKGNLGLTAHVSGTMDRPEGTIDATVDHGVFDGEPVDRVYARATYLANSIDVPQLEIRAGDSALDANARFDHPAGVLQTGNLQFRIANGRVDLARIRHIQSLRPGLAGIIQLTANGSASLRDTEPKISAQDFNLNFTGKGIAMDRKSLGDLTLTANTSGGRVNFALDSNLAGSQIQGRGTTQLTGDYPVNAQVSIHNVTWKGLQPLLGSSGSTTTDLDAVTDADLTVNGPLRQPDALNARLQVPRLELTATPPGPRNQKVTVENQGPIVVSMQRGVARIESLHITGPDTDVQANGTVSLPARTLNATLSAHSDLSLLKRFSRDIDSSGKIDTNATVRGTFDKPLVNGKLQLRNASVSALDAATGLSNANGEVDFNGSSASFQNLTGEVGGGKVVLSGFASYSQALRLGLRVNATRVRLRLQPGVSVTADADLRLSGRTDASVLSGTVTVDSITYAPQSDFGAILSGAAPPIQTASTPSPLLDNMKLDVQVRTSSATAFQAAVAQSLQADVNLRVQGTASQPGVTGRINLTEGKLNFFNSTYTVNTGTIAFYNPIRIEPILDLSLETRAKGVDVTLRVTGPVDNMKLSYTSDPPIPFQEIVGLLAAGKTPTSDPTILANQPAQPPQSVEQMGETALLSKGLADPLSQRLQRVFGVSQFKIDPTFAGSSGLPQAQLSLQQQITSRLTLTYTTALEDTSQQAVSGEFVLSRQWSATATRDQYGVFSIKFLFKKQFQ